MWSIVSLRYIWWYFLVWFCIARICDIIRDYSDWNIQCKYLGRWRQHQHQVYFSTFDRGRLKSTAHTKHAIMLFNFLLFCHRYLHMHSSANLNFSINIKLQHPVFRHLHFCSAYLCFDNQQKYIRNEPQCGLNEWFYCKWPCGLT